MSESETFKMVKIYEEEGTEKIWLQDALDDNRVPYKIVYDEYWTGTRFPEYHEVTCFFVDKSYVNIAQGLIGEYKNKGSIVPDDEDDENALPQITCDKCGKKFDLDYHKCPFCHHPV